MYSPIVREIVLQRESQTHILSSGSNENQIVGLEVFQESSGLLTASPPR